MANAQAPRNRILARLSRTDWEVLRPTADLFVAPLGTTLTAPGAPFSYAYFPEEGVVSAVGVSGEGQHVEVAAIGSDGMVGAGIVLGLKEAPIWFLVQADLVAYRVPGPTLLQLFHHSEPARCEILKCIGEIMLDVARSARCNRFHSHRERLARWLLELRRKSGKRSLALTHEFIAQMVGGPRHTVTAALAELRLAGALDYVRGHIHILDEARLRAAACECSAATPATH